MTKLRVTRILYREDPDKQEIKALNNNFKISSIPIHLKLTKIDNKFKLILTSQILTINNKINLFFKFKIPTIKIKMVFKINNFKEIVSQIINSYNPISIN